MVEQRFGIRETLIIDSGMGMGMTSILGFEVFRYARFSGRDVVVGLNWDMLALLLTIGFAVFLVHFVVREILNPTDHSVPEDDEPKEEIVENLKNQGVDEVHRFTATQRASHWIMAISVFLLMLSGFIMLNSNITIRGIAGVSWLDIHIVFSIIFIGYFIFHIGHVAYKGTWKAMWFGRRDLEDQVLRLKNFIGMSDDYPRQFKYPSAQKLLHLGVAVVSIGVVATGVVLLRRVEVPLLWGPTREFTFLGIQFGLGSGEPAWGLVTWSFVLHDLSAIFFVALVIGHIYFAIRPDEWPVSKSMITGNIPVETYAEKYSPRSWAISGLPRADGGDPEDIDSERDNAE